MPATTSHNNVTEAIISRKTTRKRRTRVVERLLAVEIPVPESRALDRPSRRASQLRHLLDTSGYTQRLLAVEIPVPESSRVDRPSCGPLIPVPESRMVNRQSHRAFIPVPESRRADTPSRRALKLGNFLELSESAQQAIPIPPLSGRPSMAEINLSASSRPESNSGCVIRRIIARLWGISPFRRPRTLDHRQLLRRLRSSRWSLGRLFRSKFFTKTTQAAPGTNVGHVALRSLGAQPYQADDTPSRETVLSSENAQAAPGTNVSHFAVRSMETQTFPVDDIPRRETALSSENVRSSDSGQPAQFLMRQAARRAQEALAKNGAGKIDKPQTQEEPRPQPVLKGILKKRSLPSLSEPLYGDPHRARPYTGMLFRDYEGCNVLRSARRSEEKLRVAAAAMHRDESDEEQPPAIRIPNLTGTFRVPSPSSSEESEFSEVTCGAGLRSSQAGLKASTSNVELSRAGFESWRAGLQTTVADFEQEIGNSSALAFEVPQIERDGDLLVETQEDAQPINDSTQNEAGHNFEQMDSEPDAEPTVVDDLRFRSADVHLANASPIARAQVNWVLAKADRQVAAEDFAGPRISIPILSGPTTEGDEQDADSMNTAPDTVATEAVVNRVPFNAADEYLATKSPRVRAYLNLIWAEEDRRIAVEDFARGMEFHQGQAAEPPPIVAGPTGNIVVDVGQETTAADSPASIIVRAPMDAYLTVIPPEIRAHVDSMWTEEAEQAAIAGFAREFAIFEACENLSEKMRE